MLANTQPRVRISPAPPLISVSGIERTKEKLKSEPKKRKCPSLNPKTSEKLRHFKGTHLSVKEASITLGVTDKTIKRWCETGKLIAIPKPYGSSVTYQIPLQAIDLIISQREQAQTQIITKKTYEHPTYIKRWVCAMASGTVNGKVYSPLTIEDYKLHVVDTINQYKILSCETLQRALMSIPPEQYAKRSKRYKALICFGKYLLQQEAIEADFLTQATPLRPKPHKPPKRNNITANELVQVFNACKTTSERVTISLLAYTGLRATEACQLNIDDIDWASNSLIVRKGKGGKSRRVGLNKALITVLNRYLQEHPNSEALILNHERKRQTRHGLCRQVERIGKRVGHHVTPHVLRRAFVTINANKGRPLQMLQMACGHSNIKTTRDYCLTSEQEVINAMQEWD